MNWEDAPDSAHPDCIAFVARVISPWLHSLNVDVRIIKWQECQSYSEQRVRESTSSCPETPLTAKRAQYSWTRAGKQKNSEVHGIRHPRRDQASPLERWEASLSGAGPQKQNGRSKAHRAAAAGSSTSRRWLMRSVHVHTAKNPVVPFDSSEI